MVMVKCKACGKRYDYKQHGCCPECGAYNRPPQRNRVGADGVVHHMSDSDFLDNSRNRRRSQGSKVCFEQDTCYEEQARKVRNGSKPWEDPLKAGRARLQKQEKARQQKGKKKPVGVAIAIAVLVSMFPSLLSACLNMAEKVVDKVGIGGLEEIFTETVPAKPEPKPDQIYTFEEAEVGDTFQWWDAKTVVAETYIDLEAEENHVIVTVEGEDVWDMPMLYYKLPDGTVVCQSCDIVEEIITGRAHKYYYQAPDMYETSGCYLEFCGYNGDAYCTTSVWLT